jgi:DNA-binding response OmpR family regulator
MTLRPTVLLVAPTPGVATTIFAWLTDAGYDLTVVGSFAAAKRHLERVPSLLISEVRLGEYNGLHLALRAQTHDVPAVLLGEADTVLQQEAREMGAVYLPRDVDRQRLLAVIEPIVTVPADTPAAYVAPNLSFTSWSEMAAPVSIAREPLRAARRRPLPS